MTTLRNLFKRLRILTGLILLVVLVFMGSCSMKKAVRSFVANSPASAEQTSVAKSKTLDFLPGDQCSHLETAAADAKVIQQATFLSFPALIAILVPAIFHTIRAREKGWKPHVLLFADDTSSVPVYLRNRVLII